MRVELPKLGAMILVKDRFLIVGIILALVTGILAAVFPILTVGFLVSLILVGGWFWVALKRPFWIIVFLIIYLPFEAIIIRYMPISGQAIIAIQFLSEIMVYSIFIVVMAKRIILKKSIRKTFLDIPLLLIVFVITASMLVNSSPLLASLVNVRTTIRYIFLYYTVVNLEISSRQITLLLRVVIIIGFIQLLIGLLQILSRGGINTYLLPNPSDLVVAGYSQQFRLLTKGREVGSIFGTLGDTVYFGLFILIILIIFLAHLRKIRLRQMIGIVILLGAIGYSFARAVTFASVLLVILFFVIRWGLKKTALLSLILLPILIAGLLILSTTFKSTSTYYNPVKQEQSIIQNLTGIFSENYVEIAKKQRLGALIGVTPTVLANRPLFGYGPDTMTTVTQLNNSKPNYLLGILPRAGFEDVYWVSILAYYGIAGVFAFAYLFYRLASVAYKIHKKAKERLTQTLALIVLFFAVTTPFLLFFSQVLEFRIFAAFFWLFPALLYQQYKQESLLRQTI